MEFSNVWMNYIYLSPLLLVVVAGVVYAAITWRRHRAVSALAMAGVVLVGFSEIVYPWLSTWMVTRSHLQGQTLVQLSQTMFTMGVINSVVLTAGVALLLIAAYGWRRS